MPIGDFEREGLSMEKVCTLAEGQTNVFHEIQAVLRKPERDSAARDGADPQAASREPEILPLPEEFRVRVEDVPATKREGSG